MPLAPSQHKPSCLIGLVLPAQVSFIAAIGSLTYGYTISAFGNVLSNPNFNEYMGLAAVGPRAGYTTTMIALWNCILYVGAFFGCGSYSLAAAKYGRRAPIAVGGALSLIGGALQAGMVNAAMCTVARLILGAGIGLLLTAVPTYQAEIAPPSGRGLIVGLHGMLACPNTAQ
jgi:MFS family permease